MENKDEDLKNIPDKYKVFAQALLEFDAESRLRFIPDDRDGKLGYDLTSNDYMGLGKQVGSFSDINLPNTYFTSSASRLLSGHQNSYERLESLLDSLYSKDTLLFNSGYHANVGIIQSLAVEGTVFLCDKLIHASMIDGLKLGSAEYRRWRHNDILSLRKLLDKYSDATRVIVMVESIYSMDGDVAPLKEIVDLKREYDNIILYIDEAHAFGVRGNKGLGLSEELGVLEDVDILIGTFGKACASAGAFVATHHLLKQYFLNTARSFIFSTALPPVNAEWTIKMIMRLVSMRREREHLMRISKIFKKGIKRITGKDSNSNSQIVPLIVGDAKEAVNLATRLSTSCVQALPIRRPTVAEGEERIRFSLSANLKEKDIENILNIIEREYCDDI